MKHILTLLSFLFIGCAVDTGTSVSPIEHDLTFPTELSYLGMKHTSYGVYLVMKNNTKNYLSVKVNYTLTCSINGNQPETITRTIDFYFGMYEQSESTNLLGLSFIGSIQTIECNGIIHSIVPDIFEEDFHTWTGEFPISTN